MSGSAPTEMPDSRQAQACGGAPRQPYGGQALTPAEIAALETRAESEGWIHRDLVAFDQFCNVTFFRGLPDETMSAHFQRMADGGNELGKMMCAWLDVIQARHGQKAQTGDEARAEKVEDTERASLGEPSDKRLGTSDE